MTERRLLVKVENKGHYKIPAIKALRALQKAIHPDAPSMGLGEAKEAMEEGILMTRDQFAVLDILFRSFLSAHHKDAWEGIYIFDQHLRPSL